MWSISILKNGINSEILIRKTLKSSPLITYTWKKILFFKDKNLPMDYSTVLIGGTWGNVRRPNGWKDDKT